MTMNSTTPLPPHILKQFAQLADYLGKAQKVALEISRGNQAQFKPIIPNLTPPKHIPIEDAWFWSKAWQKKEREANQALIAGDYVGFDDVDEAIRYLHKQA